MFRRPASASAAPSTIFATLRSLTTFVTILIYFKCVDISKQDTEKFPERFLDGVRLKISSTVYPRFKTERFYKILFQLL